MTSASNNVRNDIKLPDTQVLKTQDPAIFNSNSSSLIPMRHTLTSHITSPDVQQDIPSFIPSTFAMNNIRYREPRQWDAKRPYKPVHKKHRPVPATFPEDARVTRQFPEDPLLSLPYLSPNPPEFTPTPRLTQARLDILKINPDGFLWPEEEKLFIMVFKNNENALAYNEEERGTLRRDYFSDYIIPVVEHEPWTNTQNPIPPGIMPKVVEFIRSKINKGVYEPSQGSYRSGWFCELKKDGGLRPLIDLQTLNSVTIRDAGLPPIIDNFIEPFSGHSVYSGFDLLSGYDARILHPKSRDLTAFQTPLGLLRYTCLPQGFTNSVAEFQNCTTFILQDEIPHHVGVMIDDIGIKGPPTRYEDDEGTFETIPENDGIRRFIWEHAIVINRVLHRLAHAGATISPKKSQVARPRITLVGQTLTFDGRLPDSSRISKILKWPIPKNKTEVRGFLGLCGTLRIWILNYSLKARPLTELTRDNTPFEWTPRRQEAFDILKEAISTPPVLRPIDYSSDQPVVLSVDSCPIATGIILSQYDEKRSQTSSTIRITPYE